LPWQNYRPEKVSQFLRRIWPIIVGVLLLGHTAAPARPYLRVCKKGVIFYYFSSREHSQPQETGLNTTARRPLRPQPLTVTTPMEMAALIPNPDQRHNLRPWVIKAVTRMESKFSTKASSPQGAQDLMHLRLGKTNDLQIVNPGDLTENIWMGTRYLGRLWGKFESRALEAYNGGSQRVHRPLDLSPVRETRALVRDVCNNFLKYTQEQHPELGQGQPGYRFTGSNQLGYSFPVAPPFSFRDTWGEYRSGGRYHHAVDIFAPEGTPVYAITAGVIHQLAIWRGAGITLLMRGQDGKGYGYMHLQRYAAGIFAGRTVKPGELIAYVGRTGIQRDAAHLHLQVYADHHFCRDDLVNPYGLLVQLCNGLGVTDLFHQRIAGLQVPVGESRNFRTEVISGVVIQRGRGSQRRAGDYSTRLTNKF
jgi:murein DD-endopeptidase MepM/ murein hydrolase activator NlpD